MVENRPWVTFFSHAVLVLGVLAVAFPLYVTFVASTLTLEQIMQVPMPLLPGDQLVKNYSQVLGAGTTTGSKAAGSSMLFNSLVMALVIPLGKIAVSVIASFAIVYFRFPLRMFFFWMIFVTLMLPVEVRIIPTFKVISDLGMLNTYAGLTVPLIASATATFVRVSDAFANQWESRYLDDGATNESSKAEPVAADDRSSARGESAP